MGNSQVQNRFLGKKDKQIYTFFSYALNGVGIKDDRLTMRYVLS